MYKTSIQPLGRGLSNKLAQIEVGPPSPECGPTSVEIAPQKRARLPDLGPIWIEAFGLDNTLRGIVGNGVLHQPCAGSDHLFAGCSQLLAGLDFLRYVFGRVQAGDRPTLGCAFDQTQDAIGHHRLATSQQFWPHDLSVRPRLGPPLPAFGCASRLGGVLRPVSINLRVLRNWEPCSRLGGNIHRLKSWATGKQVRSRLELGRFDQIWFAPTRALNSRLATRTAQRVGQQHHMASRSSSLEHARSLLRMSLALPLSGLAMSMPASPGMSVFPFCMPQRLVLALVACMTRPCCAGGRSNWVRLGATLARCRFDFDAPDRRKVQQELGGKEPTKEFIVDYVERTMKAPSAVGPERSCERGAATPRHGTRRRFRDRAGHRERVNSEESGHRMSADGHSGETDNLAQLQRRRHVVSPFSVCFSAPAPRPPPSRSSLLPFFWGSLLRRFASCPSSSSARHTTALRRSSGKRRRQRSSCRASVFVVKAEAPCGVRPTGRGCHSVVLAHCYFPICLRFSTSSRIPLKKRAPVRASYSRLSAALFLRRRGAMQAVT